MVIVEYLFKGVQLNIAISKATSTRLEDQMSDIHTGADDYDDDDILSDVRNLFIESEDGTQVEEQKPAEVTHKIVEETRPIFVQEEQPKPVPQTIFDSTLLKGPVEVKPKPVPPATKQPPLPAGKIIAEPKPKVIYQSPPKSDKCKSNSDCKGESFCIIKTGKCVAKLLVGHAGCSADDQCQGKGVGCYSKTCRLLCNTQSENGVCDGGNGQECVETREFKALKAYDGLYNGVCDKAKATPKNPEITSGRLMSNTSKSSIAILGSVIILLLIGLTVLFVYFRGYMRRRYRNNNPDMFLFNKLQKNTNQVLGQQPAQQSADRLNERISGVSGARFTRWAALSDENN